MNKLDKVLKVINSCETLEQLEVARKYINLAKLSSDDYTIDILGRFRQCSWFTAIFALWERQVILIGEHEDEGVEDYGWC